MKKFLTLLISLFMIVTGTSPYFVVYAKDLSSTTFSNESYTWIVPLDQESYENTIYDESGEPATLTVSTMPSITRVSSGTKLISYSSANIYMSFSINVSSNKITNAYDPQYSFEYAKVKNHTLVYSSSSASLTVNVNTIANINIKHVLSATIKNSQLITTFN